MAQIFAPIRRSVKFDAWPPRDQQAWMLALEPGDILEPGGAAAAWSPATRGKYVEDFGRWLNWWNTNGTGDPNGPLSDRLTPLALKAYIIELEGLHKRSTLIARIIGLHSAIRAMAPDQDWDWVRIVIRRLQLQTPAPETKMGRLVSSGELFNFGIRLMVTAEAEAATAEIAAWRAAEHFRDGLMIAFLAARPIRRRNFASIEIGRHLVRVGSGYVLRFEAGETKTKRALECPFPTNLLPWLERYLDLHRPILRACATNQVLERRRRDPGQALWVSTTGTALQYRGISDAVIHETTKEFGKRINMHLFRDAAATSIALEDPEHVQITATILGHCSMKTSEKFYNHAQGMVAAGLYQDTIETLRKAARSASSGRRRHVSATEGT